MAMSPSQRPVGVLGFWSSLMTALGNTENMPVSVSFCLNLISSPVVPLSLLDEQMKHIWAQDYYNMEWI